MVGGTLVAEDGTESTKCQLVAEDEFLKPGFDERWPKDKEAAEASLPQSPGDSVVA